MKTQSEILAETQIIERRVHRELENVRKLFGVNLPDRALEIRFPLPTNTIAVSELPTGRSVQLSTMRTIVATNLGAGFEYQVNERWVEQSPNSPPEVQDKVIVKTPSANHALYMAYFSMEAQRLLVTLRPFEPSTQATPGQASTERINTVETLVNAELLSASEKLRTRVDVVDFLQGRLSAPALVQKTIHRLYRRHGEQQSQTLDHRQSMGES